MSEGGRGEETTAKKRAMTKKR